uniref:Uncharacterized protein n=1 Tax=Timema poppense TaxID=170557 RepID=A0A7R9DJC8_TIMPO|nr:unnamed protein product [Timema poppensis]
MFATSVDCFPNRTLQQDVFILLSIICRVLPVASKDVCVRSCSSLDNFVNISPQDSSGVTLIQPTTGTRWKHVLSKSGHSATANRTTNMLVEMSVALSESGHGIERRISSFIERKREQVNLSNIHDFCHRDNVQVETSCARVNAVLLCRKDSKSHLRVRRVLNQWGPQTRGVDPGSVSDPRDPALIHNQPQGPPGVAVGIEERLRNAENHLMVKGPVPSDIYARLKQIEDRILYLESVSPEYFQLSCYTTADIDNKLQELESELRIAVSLSKRDQVTISSFALGEQNSPFESWVGVMWSLSATLLVTAVGGNVSPSWELKCTSLVESSWKQYGNYQLLKIKLQSRQIPLAHNVNREITRLVDEGMCKPVPLVIVSKWDGGQSPPRLLEHDWASRQKNNWLNGTPSRYENMRVFTAVVIDALGRNMYRVRFKEGLGQTRHIDQL